MDRSTHEGATPLPPWTPTQERLASVVVRLMTAANVWVYRLTGGWLGGTFLRGAPVCLVTTRGKRSGQPRTVALLYLADGNDVVLVASKGGMSHHPAWYHNMVAHPDVEVQIGGSTGGCGRVARRMPRRPRSGRSWWRCIATTTTTRPARRATSR